jgi:hypothetical protein
MVKKKITKLKEVESKKGVVEFIIVFVLIALIAIFLLIGLFISKPFSPI